MEKHSIKKASKRVTRITGMTRCCNGGRISCLECGGKGRSPRVARVEALAWQG